MINLLIPLITRDITYQTFQRKSSWEALNVPAVVVVEVFVDLPTVMLWTAKR